ncbi:hypothetical protein GCM10027280_06310 [Micromonospora polyrhachis]|uniref:Secreted protein n=1 Tax=Micromonospora polyrhachis TaxID=1282883 RepID=A0A7W7SKH0_9ACTN|nr:hypothetical protein [Micromonospora polyrhachis]MBB4956459.1 hypothetical protein [Micromonospora polyrhachis]
MRTSLRTRLLVRAATVALVCTGATLGLSTAANAAPAEVTNAPSTSVEMAALVDPYSLWPGPGWFYNGSVLAANLEYAKSVCLTSGWDYVAAGLARNLTCALRYDYSGYDLWLLY